MAPGLAQVRTGWQHPQALLATAQQHSCIALRHITTLVRRGSTEVVRGSSAPDAKTGSLPAHTMHDLTPLVTAVVTGHLGELVALVRQIGLATVAGMSNVDFAGAEPASVTLFLTGVRAPASLPPAWQRASLTSGLRYCAWRAYAVDQFQADDQILLARSVLRWHEGERQLTCWHGLGAILCAEGVARDCAEVNSTGKVASTWQPPVHTNYHQLLVVSLRCVVHLTIRIRDKKNCAYSTPHNRRSQSAGTSNRVQCDADEQGLHFKAPATGLATRVQAGI
jgi:hypothetical protein